MKKIINLNMKLTTLVKGEEMKMSPTEVATVKSIIIDALSIARKLTGNESARAWAYAQALLKTTEDSALIEDQDADILKRCIEEQSYMVQVKEPVKASIVNAEEVKPSEEAKSAQ